MSSRIRALCALFVCLVFLPGCVPAGLGLVQAAISAGSTGIGVAGAIGQMNAQDRACANMSLAERRTASVSDRVTCESVWRRMDSDPNFRLAGARQAVQPQPNRSCQSFQDELLATVQANNRRPAGTAVRMLPIARTDIERCRINEMEARLRTQYPRAFETQGSY